MQEFPSRSEKRLTKLHSAAEKGLMYLDNELLYGSEIKRYQKHGFDVSHTPSSFKNLNLSSIDWSNAFMGEIPYSVVYYVTGIISLYPSSDIKTLAQELYVIAALANHNKE